ncbi:MAG: outer membrane beta-barrel protein [bacterium]
MSVNRVCPHRSPTRVSARRLRRAALARVAAAHVLLVVVTLSAARAAETSPGIGLGPFALLPALGLEAGYDDNILLRASDAEADEVLRAVARFDLRLPRPGPDQARAAPPPPDSERPIATPSEILDALSPRWVFPSDFAPPVAGEDPPVVARRAAGLSRARPATTLDVGYEASGTLFVDHDEFNTVDQSVSGAALKTLAGGFALGAAGEWIDRTTVSSDLTDFAQYASDVRLAGADFDRGAGGVLVGWEPTSAWYLEADYLYYVTSLGPEPYDLFGFHVHEAALKVRRTLDTGWELEPRVDLGRIDGEADAESLRRSGLVPPFVPLDFTGDPRAAYLAQGSFAVRGPLTPKLSIDSRAGIQSRTFDETTLDGYLDFLVEASLQWKPQSNLEIEIGGSRAPIDVFGSDGSFLVRNEAVARVALEFLRDWDAHLRVDGGMDTFDQSSSLTGRQREDQFLGGELGVGWQPQPWLRVEAIGRSRWRSSNVSEEDTERSRIALRCWLRY